MPFPRPPPEYTGTFADLAVLPEIKGYTIRRLSLAGKAIRVWCRACGRETVITPTGLYTIFRKRMDQTIEEIAPTLKCETCGSKEAQISQFVLEHEDRRLSFVRREHARAALKIGG